MRAKALLQLGFILALHLQIASCVKPRESVSTLNDTVGTELYAWDTLLTLPVIDPPPDSRLTEDAFVRIHNELHRTLTHWSEKEYPPADSLQVNLVPQGHSGVKLLILSPRPLTKADLAYFRKLYDKGQRLYAEEKGLIFPQ